MNYLALDPDAGKPMPGDLVRSALPAAPVEEPRPRRPLLALAAHVAAWFTPAPDLGLRRTSSSHQPSNG